AAQRAQELPAPREVGGEEEREQQTDGFDRLYRTEVHLRAAAARAAAERDEQRAQADRADERQIAQLEPRDALETDQRARGQQREAGEHAFGLTDEERDVAQGIGSAQQHDEADAGDEVRDREQESIAVDAAQPPDQRHEVEAGDVEDAPP